MRQGSDEITKIYVNVMEELVHEELERQLKSCPPSLSEYIQPIEIATYALNRLPPLYASSEKGKHQQKMIGRQQYKEHIKIAVRQGLAAVRRDPLRSSIPLVSELELKYVQAEKALKDLQVLFEEQDLGFYQQLTWQNVAEEFRRVFRRLHRFQEHGVKTRLAKQEEKLDRSPLREWYDYREYNSKRMDAAKSQLDRSSY